MRNKDKDIKIKRLYADCRAQYWLGLYNTSIEKGHTATAEKRLSKAQYWLDRLNKLEGRS